ncbi:hypothetical protein G3M48_010090 [Beauveria asiatica]|uniref:Uncharacterized protein n=1 Tax=Beauveria asiatica TaxID=1069075 RepID=A0AAW0RI64_9HYPO
MKTPVILAAVAAVVSAQHTTTTDVANVVHTTPTMTGFLSRVPSTFLTLTHPQLSTSGGDGSVTVDVPSTFEQSEPKTLRPRSEPTADESVPFPSTFQQFEPKGHRRPKPTSTSSWGSRCTFRPEDVPAKFEQFPGTHRGPKGPPKVPDPNCAHPPHMVIPPPSIPDPERAHPPRITITPTSVAEAPEQSGTAPGGYMPLVAEAER